MGKVVTIFVPVRPIWLARAFAAPAKLSAVGVLPPALVDAKAIAVIGVSMAVTLPPLMATTTRIGVVRGVLRLVASST
jgi:hypothetical protein